MKLTREESERLIDYRNRAESWHDEMQAEAGKLNMQITALYSQWNERINRFNAFQEEVRGFVEDIGCDRRDVWDNRSERWQNSENGQSVNDWIEEYETFCPTDAEEATIPEVEWDSDLPQLLDTLPEESN